MNVEENRVGHFHTLEGIINQRVQSHFEKQLYECQEYHLERASLSLLEGFLLIEQRRQQEQQQQEQLRSDENNNDDNSSISSHDDDDELDHNKKLLEFIETTMREKLASSLVHFVSTSLPIVTTRIIRPILERQLAQYKQLEQEWKQEIARLGGGEIRTQIGNNSEATMTPSRSHSRTIRSQSTMLQKQFPTRLTVQTTSTNSYENHPVPQRQQQSSNSDNPSNLRVTPLHKKGPIEADHPIVLKVINSNSNNTQPNLIRNLKKNLKKILRCKKSKRRNNNGIAVHNDGMKLLNVSSPERFTPLDDDVENDDLATAATTPSKIKDFEEQLSISNTMTPSSIPEFENQEIANTNNGSNDDLALLRRQGGLFPHDDARENKLLCWMMPSSEVDYYNSSETSHSSDPLLDLDLRMGHGSSSSDHSTGEVQTIVLSSQHSIDENNHIDPLRDGTQSHVLMERLDQALTSTEITQELIEQHATSDESTNEESSGGEYEFLMDTSCYAAATVEDSTTQLRSEVQDVADDKAAHDDAIMSAKIQSASTTTRTSSDDECSSEDDECIADMASALDDMIMSHQPQHQASLPLALAQTRMLDTLVKPPDTPVSTSSAAGRVVDQDSVTTATETDYVATSDSETETSDPNLHANDLLLLHPQ